MSHQLQSKLLECIENVQIDELEQICPESSQSTLLNNVLPNGKLPIIFAYEKLLKYITKIDRQNSHNITTQNHKQKLINCILIILKRGANPNVEVSDRRNPLLFDSIIRCQCEKLTISLLEHRANPNTVSRDGVDPLNASLSLVKDPNPMIITALIVHGANINVKYGGNAPLYIAAQKYNGSEVCRMLLEYKANPNEQNSEGLSALHIAAEQGNLQTVSELLKCENIHVNIEDENSINPLGKAARSYKGNHLKVCTVLVDAGATLYGESESDKDTLTSIDSKIEKFIFQAITTKENDARLARARGMPLELHYLQDAIINKDIKNIGRICQSIPAPFTVNDVLPNGRFALVLAYEMILDNYHTEYFKPVYNKPRFRDADRGKCFLELLNFGADANVVLPNKGLLLEDCIDSNQHEEIICSLIDHGADPNASKYKCTKPLNSLLISDDITEEESVFNIAKRLLEHGADVHFKYAGDDDALHYSVCSRGDENLCRLLLEFKANPNTANSEGLPVLHGAVRRRGNEGCMLALLGFNADVNIQDANGNTALHAMAIKQTEIEESYIRVLLNHGIHVETRNNLGETALDIAIRNNHNTLRDILIMETERYHRRLAMAMTLHDRLGRRSSANVLSSDMLHGISNHLN